MDIWQKAIRRGVRGLELLSDSFIEQIEGAVDDALPMYGETLIERIKCKKNWTYNEPFYDMKFAYEHARFCFNSLINIAEMIGFDEDEFAEELRLIVEEIVHHRYDVYMKHLQEDYEYELITSIERREAV